MLYLNRKKKTTSYPMHVLLNNLTLSSLCNLCCSQSSKIYPKKTCNVTNLLVLDNCICSHGIWLNDNFALLNYKKSV